MTYQVLARKWRPRDFSTLVGQDHVVRALTHALDQQRLHHAYLFTGTRGVGKTTLSRILAKALNCDTGITSRPCGVCRACTEIDAGRFVDYVEMDAASNRGVDEMAALLERAIYAPVDARFKVYMIDEVHMLTNHAFNAMLKTLEEPPAHVKFILATTDPQKIPVTVLSRCLQFNLKQMPANDIVGHLSHVLHEEAIAFEPQALRLLARAAGGSMRDALSLTDQAIAYSAGSVGEDAVRGMLGALDQHYLVRLLDALVAQDGPALLAVADEMAVRSLSFSTALQDLAQWLNRIGWAQCAPGSVLDEWPEAADVRRFATELHPEQIQLYYQIATIGRSEIGLAPDEYAGFTMTLLRMLAFRPMGGPGAGVSTNGTAPRANGPAAPVARTSAAAAIASKAVLVTAPDAKPALQNLAAVAEEVSAQPVAVGDVASAKSAPVAESVAAKPAPAAEAAPVKSVALAAEAPARPVEGSSVPGRQASAADADASVVPAAPVEEQGDVPPASPAQAALAALGILKGGTRSRSGEASAPATARRAAPPSATSMANAPSAALPSALSAASPSISSPRTNPDRAASALRSAAPSAPSASSRPAARPYGGDASDGMSGQASTPPPWEDIVDGALSGDDGAAAAFFASMEDGYAPELRRADERPTDVSPASRATGAGEALRDGDVRTAAAPRAMTAKPSGPALTLSALGCEQDWPTFAATLDVKGLAQQLAHQSELVAVEAGRLTVRVPGTTLAAGAHVDKVAGAIRQALGCDVALHVEIGPATQTAAAVASAQRAALQQRAEQAIREDAFVQTLLQEFDASIIPGSTQPVAR